MARIVLGIGTSHTPLLTLDSHEWEHRADADRANEALNLSDGRWLTYPQLLAQVGPRYQEIARPAVLHQKWLQCEAALDLLAAALASAAPDLVVIVGDDQRELFGPANQPAFAIYHADDLVTSDAFGREGSPDWVLKMGRGYLMDARHAIRGDGVFGTHLVSHMVDAGVDVASVGKVQGDDGGLGHAFGFVVQRLMRELRVPIVPVLLNTYYPPNVPTPARCIDIGRALRTAIEAHPSQRRVAVIASGGLSHFVVDEELDRRVLAAMQSGDLDVLRSIPRGALNSGSSEILNWVLAAGAVDPLPIRSIEYLPLYRTPAGTGVGAGFVVWAD